MSASGPKVPEGAIAKGVAPGASMRIARNAISMLASDAGGEVLTSYAVALAALSLGPAGFGVLSAGQAFMDPFDALAGFGLGQIAVTLAARRGGCDGALRGTLLGLRTVFGVLAALIAVATAFLTGRRELVPLLLVLSIATVTFPVAHTSILPFQYEQAMHRLIALPFLASVVRLGLAYMAFFYDRTPLGFIIAGCGASMTLSALHFYFARRYYPTKMQFDWGLARRLIVAAWPVAVLEVVVMIYLRGSYFLLRASGAEALGQYAAADKLVRPFLSVSSAILASSLPTVALIAADHQFERLRRIYRQSIFRAASVLLPVAGIACVVLPWILTRYASEYRDSSGPFRILVFGGMFMFLNQLSSTFIIGMGRFRTIMLIALCNLVVYFALAAYLVPRFAATGAAAATSLMEGLNTIIQLIVVRQLIHRSIRERAAQSP
jgi:O-antigen/teichoic acid export membrane protein